MADTSSGVLTDLTPGSLGIHPQSPHPKISVLGYSTTNCEVLNDATVEDIERFNKSWEKVWINVEGLGSEEILIKIARLFEIHRLALEDVAHIYQRAKYDEYDNHSFVVLRMMHKELGKGSEQLSLVIGKNHLITFQEDQDGDCLDKIRQRIIQDKGQIRKKDIRYLSYTVLDAVVDGYFPVIETFGDELAKLEEEASEQGVTQDFLHQVHKYKRTLRDLRRDIWPLREMLNTLIRDNSSLLNKETTPYFRDLLDHAIRLIEIIETYRDGTADVIELYHSAVSNRLNEIMKVLTIISTIFIPMSFVTGLYGMNFHTDKSPWNMPELNWYFGYPFALGMMALVAATLLGFFHYKKWI